MYKLDHSMEWSSLLQGGHVDTACQPFGCTRDCSQFKSTAQVVEHGNHPIRFPYGSRFPHRVKAEFSEELIQVVNYRFILYNYMLESADSAQFHTRHYHSKVGYVRRTLYSHKGSSFAFLISIFRSYNFDLTRSFTWSRATFTQCQALSHTTSADYANFPTCPGYTAHVESESILRTT